MVHLIAPVEEPLDPIDALRRVAFLMERTRAGSYRVEAFRKAVKTLKDWRGLKVGDALMEAVIGEAEKRGQTKQTLSAQVHAAPFYERLGFNIVSEEFLEVGIPHVDMVREA